MPVTPCRRKSGGTGAFFCACLEGWVEGEKQGPPSTRLQERNMSVTYTSSTGAENPHSQPTGWRRFVYSTNHKDIGNDVSRLRALHRNDWSCILGQR